MSAKLKISSFIENLRAGAAKFKPISLKEMPSESQMSRYDFKFIFPAKFIPDLVSEASNYYKILEVKNKRVLGYQSEYYDTSEYGMYNDHHNGKGERYKIRMRKYTDTGDQYLEIKKKSNKELMTKKRVKVCVDGLSLEAEKLIRKHTPYDNKTLQQTLKTRFYRLTLVDPDHNERITIDCHLELMFKNKKITLPALGIVEIKKADQHYNSEFEKILHKNSIQPTNFSKYCTGLALLEDGIKYNNFKRKILTIKKFENELEIDA